MAFKMNRDGFTFYTKPKGHTKHHEMGPTKTIENKGYPKYGHDKGPTKMMENKGYPKTIAKPDFLDADGDGHKEESMKKAFADKASKTTKEQIPNVTSNLKKTPYEKNKYSSHMPKHGGTKPQSQMTEDELAEHKGIKKPQSQRIPQGDFGPMFMGGDISKEEFDKMSKKEQEEYMEKYAAD